MESNRDVLAVAHELPTAPGSLLPEEARQRRQDNDNGNDSKNLLYGESGGICEKYTQRGRNDRATRSFNWREKGRARDQLGCIKEDERDSAERVLGRATAVRWDVTEREFLVRRRAVVEVELQTSVKSASEMC